MNDQTMPISLPWSHGWRIPPYLAPVSFPEQLAAARLYAAAEKKNARPGDQPDAGTDATGDAGPD
ncbi:hypothetical protein I6A60_12285 [Frankia sp. AgB1.9]|uniref:hypothetical protein n=1 Tax=unclassified Frankia TaxID=2632575 RepID=UPI001931605B|nr:MULTISPECIES: hypothetical protein [unclassified Frankia]MBL7490221.1 hypothetical protein [Frankia sp. AgW1.1]MBL7548648.1 hypothetical protein [Frankia sp. AgB1.9]MBL7623507.1 hypothetical protein [Frankia sp. AgB1.8]